MSGNRRGGALAAVLIGMAAVLVVLVAGAVGFGIYMARHVAVKEHGDKVRVETPFGSVRVTRHAKADPRLLGIPLYPGATRVDDRRRLASVEFDFGDEHNEFAVMAAEYTTPDSAAKVAAFYRDQLPSWIFKQKRGGEWEIHLSEKGYKRMIGIQERHGETHLVLASIGEPAAN